MSDAPDAARAVAAPSSKISRPKRSAAIAVDLEQCKMCGICAGLCPKNVFDRDEAGHPLVARPEDCTICRFCEQHCPDFAIEVVELAAGQDAGRAPEEDA
jgi:2-oxoglutarate ferredoxin oxidoreductase subunit delta